MLDLGLDVLFKGKNMARLLGVRVACLPASSARFCRPQAYCLPLRCFRAVRPARAFCHTANI